MRAFRFAATSLLILLLLALNTAWLLPPLLNWNQYRQTVAAVVSAGLGRPVRIDGAIRLSLLPQATLRAGNVTIADRGDGASATATEMQLRVGLFGLLAGKVQPRDLVLQGAQMHLPWPLSASFLREGRPAAGLHAELEGSTLDIGSLALTGITGDLSVDPASGILSANGFGTVLGRSWRLTGRLGRPGADGSASIEVSLDGQGSLINTGALISGQVGEAGGLSGRVTGRGPNLSLLLPAPAVPWRADGRVVAESGLAVADDLEAEIGGARARGALALRFLPQLRLDAAMATSRLDLDAWLPHLAHGDRTALPTGIDLSAESATLAGGTLQRLRAGFDLEPDGTVLRDASALLPGNADLHLTGRLQGGRFSGAGQLTAPDLPQTLSWLQPQAPALLALIPAGVLQSAAVSGAVLLQGDRLALSHVQGQLDGAAIAGDMALRTGDEAAVAASIKLVGPVLDPWLAAPSPRSLGRSLGDAVARVASSAARLGALRADITLDASQPVWAGVKFDRLELGLRSGDGLVQLRQAVLTAPQLTVGLSGTIGKAAQLTDGRLDLRLGDASVLAASLPPSWRSAEPLFRGPATLQAIASGPPSALRFSTAATLSSAELQLDGLLDLPARSWTGGVSLRHPGAPRLLETLGLPGSQPWLGDGSLSLQADVSSGADRVALGNLEAAAGAFRATGDVTVSGLASGHPSVSGEVKAETLPLPLPYARSTDPWLLTAWQGWSGHLAVQAGQVLFGLSPGLEHASATLALDGSALRLDDFSAGLSAGRLTGRLSLDAASPPHLAASAKLANVVLSGPLLGAALDVSAGRLDASADLSASGYSPAGLLASLGFTLQATVRDGTLDGINLAAAQAALSPAPAANAQPAGSTPTSPPLPPGSQPPASLPGPQPPALPPDSQPPASTSDSQPSDSLSDPQSRASLPGSQPSASLPNLPAPNASPDPTEVQARLAAALDGGLTPFDQLDLSATADHGGVTFSHVALTTPFGRLSGNGTLDLPTDTLLAYLALQPVEPGAPPIGLRLSGPAAAPLRTSEFGDLAQWLAARRD